MTSIEYLPGTDSFKVIVRLDYVAFLHDYQQSVNDDIDLKVLSKYRPFPVDMASHYINSKLSIYVNGNLLTGKIQDILEPDENIILNIFYRLKTRMKKLTIRNTILTGLNSDVENLTIIKIGDFEKGIKLTREHSEETFILKGVKPIR